jgi:carboxyl-terminal processing protease
MVYKLSSTILLFIIAVVTTAQVNHSKTAKHALLITQMANKFHVQPTPLNQVFAERVFTTVLHELDEEKIIFTQQQIQQLQPLSVQLHQSILQQNTQFLQQLTTLYKQQLVTTDSLIVIAANKPINFTIVEKYTIQEDTSFAANVLQQQQKINKIIKLNILQYIVAYWPEKRTVAQQKKFTDSIEPIARKKIVTGIRRSFNTLLQQSIAAETEVASAYCNSIAKAYDPHSSYFSPDTKTAFESGLGKKPLRFGFSLDENDDGSVEINNLKPGSAAYKSGLLNSGDKITALQWEGKETISVADKGSSFISNALDGNSNLKLTLTVKKADGSLQKVVLQKEEIDNGEDEAKVKSFVLKGSKAIGYISLPAFYEDWESTETGINGCANDVGKEILKLTKENIEGLIIDVRYNGGGSMQEAIELAGIFIDAGPVGQIKAKAEKPITLKDINRGTLYNGPLVVLVNGYSASAAEMLAGTLQDYNRAVIVGANTFGKATAQVVLPLDTSISLQESHAKAMADGYIKITVSSLYRVTGKTAQITGVEPHIVLPDVLSVVAETEAKEPLALQMPPIEANKYYKPFDPIPIKNLQLIADTIVSNWPVFKAIKSKAAYTKQQQQQNTSLLLTDVLANYTTEESNDAIEAAKNAATDIFTIANTNLENKRLGVSTANNFMNTQWKEYLTKDPYIKTAFLIATAMAIK